MMCVPSTPLELASPFGIASLAEFSSRWTRVERAGIEEHHPRRRACALPLVSVSITAHAGRAPGRRIVVDPLRPPRR